MSATSPSIRKDGKPAEHVFARGSAPGDRDRAVTWVCTWWTWLAAGAWSEYQRSGRLLLTVQWSELDRQNVAAVRPLSLQAATGLVAPMDVIADLIRAYDPAREIVMLFYGGRPLVVVWLGLDPAPPDAARVLAN